MTFTLTDDVKNHIIKNLSVRHSQLHFNVFIKALREVLSLMGKVKVIAQYS